jgi:putative serine protease PepD
VPVSSAAKASAVVAAALLAGAAVGAGAYAVLDRNNTVTTAEVRPVTITQAVQAAVSPGKALTVGSIYKLAYRGVVKITVTSTSSSGFPSGQTEKAQGSGFVYDDAGHIVTNQHVVDGAQSISVQFWNGHSYPATLVGADPSTDTAVIKVAAPASMLYPLQLGDSSAVQVGDNVVAIGSPFGLSETVTSGIVSALHREMTSPNNFTIDDSIQTDAAINHGNSGGPLLNQEGKVIGMNSQIESDSGGNDGVGFAVPSNTMHTIADKLISSGKVEHAYLGVQLSSAASGVRLDCVSSGTAAAKAGLKQGDVVTVFAGKGVKSIDDLRNAVDAKQPGAVVSVTYTRSGTSHTAHVTLGARPTIVQGC